MNSFIDPTRDPLAHTFDNTEYNRRMQQESLNNKTNEMVKNIKNLESKLAGTRQMDLPVTDMMDLLEETIKTCGGESKVIFLDVSEDTIMIQSRVPLTANLFPFKEESDDNPRFHKTVTKLIKQIWKVHGVRWIEGEDRSSIMVVSIKRNF